MNPAIETREVIAVTVGGNCLWGTYHRSQGARSAIRGYASEIDRVGVLFLNPGFLPRASPSAVYWAESFAECGYPAFRFDLPGLGDSEGDVPGKMLEFVSAGGYAPILSAIVKQIVERFRLSGVVIMGLCAGAVTALFTAAVSKDCRGVVLMDPYFFLPQERLKLRDEFSHCVAWSRLAATGSEIYHRLRHLHLLVRGNRLPRNANLPLLRCWKEVTSAGMPILLLKAPALKTQGTKPRVGEFDYLGYLQALSDRNSRITMQLIEGTNHSFADAAGCSGVRQHAIEWLNVCFPVVQPGENALWEQLTVTH